MDELGNNKAKKIKILGLEHLYTLREQRTVSRIEQNCWKKMGNKDDIFPHARESSVELNGLQALKYLSVEQVNFQKWFKMFKK